MGKVGRAEATSFLANAGVFPRPMPSVDPDAALLASLDVCEVATWQTHTDALPKRFAQALSAAIIEAEPKAKRVVLPSRTLRSAKDVEDWLADAKTEIETARKDGPVII